MIKRTSYAALWMGLLCALSLTTGCSKPHNGAGTETKAKAGSSKTVGFMVSTYLIATYGNRDKAQEECPDGFSEKPDLDAIAASLPASQRKKLGQDQLTQYLLLGQRGPEVQTKAGHERLDVCAHPSAVPDPRMPVYQGKAAFGLNLDGNDGKSPSAQSCNQSTFVSPEGELGINNAFQRIFGCLKSVHEGPRMSTFQQLYLESGHAIVIELTDVDDLVNDPDVGVGIYMSPDSIPKGADGKPLPYATMKITTDPYWRNNTRGHIKDGVLTTEPTELHLQDIIQRRPGFNLFRNARLKLALNAEDGTAKGLMGGYIDVDLLDQNHMSHAGETGMGYKCEAVYYAIHRYADGLPDPDTGKCTGVSIAFRMEAVPAYLTHVADADKGAASDNKTAKN